MPKYRYYCGECLEISTLWHGVTEKMTECPTCGAKLFPVVHEKIDKNDPEESKADKVCHCCGKKFMVLFGC